MQVAKSYKRSDERHARRNVAACRTFQASDMRNTAKRIVTAAKARKKARKTFRMRRSFKDHRANQQQAKLS